MGFWKVFLGVVAALAVSGLCLVGGCVLLLGGGSAVQQEAQRTALNATKVDVDAFAQDSAYARVTGSVTNLGTRKPRYWKATAEFLDKAGRVIDTDYTNSTTGLAPGASERFELTAQPPRSTVRVQMRVDEVLVSP